MGAYDPDGSAGMDFGDFGNGFSFSTNGGGIDPNDIFKMFFS